MIITLQVIALCTLIHGESYDVKFARLLELSRKLSGNDNLKVDEFVYMSEKKNGNKNRALSYMLKAYGLIHDPVEEILDFYFKACSILVNCRDLAQIANVFAYHGLNPATGEQIFPKEFARYVNATLATCGMYDGSGEFALNVGFPAKSGVAGVQMMVQLSQAMDLSIY